MPRATAADPWQVAPPALTWWERLDQAVTRFLLRGLTAALVLAVLWTILYALAPDVLLWGALDVATWINDRR